MFIVFSLSLLAMLHARPILIKFDHHVFYKLHYYCDYQYITIIADFSELVYRFQDFYYKVFTCCLLIVQTQKSVLLQQRIYNTVFLVSAICRHTARQRLILWLLFLLFLVFWSLGEVPLSNASWE